jgi:plastocyanin
MAAPTVTPTSHTEAGYTAAITGSTFLLKTQLTVPTLTCTGQAGLQPGAYLMTATSSTGGAVYVACSAETPVYEAVATINGVRTVLTKVTVSPGDAVKFNVTVSATATSVAVIDATKGTRQSESGAGSAPTHLFVGDQAVPSSGGGYLAVPSFGKLRFRTTTLNKVDFGSTTPAAVNMANAANVVQITTGKLSATGAAFVTTFVHS